MSEGIELAKNPQQELEDRINALPKIEIYYDFDEQQVARVHFDDKVFKKWTFVLAVFDMARAMIEAELEMRQAAMKGQVMAMQAQEQKQMNGVIRRLQHGR